ncbi:MAG TPA: CBS domain-containing protein [Xanthobacteraceae bacterium]|nr:CBS domain-containing protein [Xanthobacteraceae bacterium]
MQAADVMTRDVITVASTACVQDAARLLLDHRISGLPVVDENGRLVGMVSEGDLIRRPENHTERRPSWWIEFLTPRETLAREFTYTHSRRIADVMTREVITAAPDTPLSEIAELLEKNRIKRVPIVEDGRIVGIVSRANLLHGLVALSKEPAALSVADKQLRESVMARLRAEPWARLSLVNVVAHAGTIDLWGIVDSEAERKALRVAVEITPGVKAVNDNLMVMPLPRAV